MPSKHAKLSLQSSGKPSGLDFRLEEKFSRDIYEDTTPSHLVDEEQR